MNLITSSAPLLSQPQSVSPERGIETFPRRIIKDRIEAEKRSLDKQDFSAGRIPITTFLALVPEKADSVLNLLSGLSASEFTALSVATDQLVPKAASSAEYAQALRDIFLAQDEKNFLFLLINTIKGPNNVLHGRVMAELSVNPEIETLHAMTFNIWGIPGYIGGKDFWRFSVIADYLAKSPLDIVCLQEVFHPEAKRSLKELADRQGLYISTVEQHKLFGMIGSNGLHTISRLPTLNCQFVPFKAALGFQRLVKKGFLHTEHLLRSGETLHVFNLHLQSTIRNTPVEKVQNVRVQQMRQLAEYAGKVVKPEDVVMYLGDFNISASDPESAEISKLLASDSWSSSNTPELTLSPPKDDPQSFFSGDTYNPLLNPYAREMKISNVRKVPERIDRILMSDPQARNNAVMMTAADFRSQQGALSDHESVSILRVRF